MDDKREVIELEPDSSSSSSSEDESEEDFSDNEDSDNESDDYLDQMEHENWGKSLIHPTCLPFFVWSKENPPPSSSFAHPRTMLTAGQDLRGPLMRTSYQKYYDCLLYTSPSPRDGLLSRMPSSA